MRIRTVFGLPGAASAADPAADLAADLADRIDAASSPLRAALLDRLRTAVATLAARDGRTGPAGSPPTDTRTLVEELAACLVDPPVDRIWLALAVLGAQFPDGPAVRRTMRAARLDGPLAALDRALFTAALAGDPLAPQLRVEVVCEEILVDLDNTSSTSVVTGIQRVARETARRWVRDHEPLLVGWHPTSQALRRLTPAQARHGVTGRAADDEAHIAADPVASPVLVPWRSTYLLPELRAETALVEGLHSLLRYSGNRSGAIVFDCVPVTSAETVVEGMSAGFVAGLAALAHADRIAAISAASGAEYAGWRTMLAGAGRTGPDIAAVDLPVERVDVTADGLAAARARFVLGELPMVLVVGSHEPRKNHLAVLHAAEVCWREGVAFSLLFIGGHAWRSETFERQVRVLQHANRPLHVLSAVGQDELWAAYRLARCSVFPSLNEGFGLPVAESLASGTPVITSNFGSMREIADDGGGALLIDPRDDRALADAIRSLVEDDSVHAMLSAQASARNERTWDEYADETWHYLVPDRGASRG